MCVCFFQLYTWGWKWNQRATRHPPETKTESIPSLVDSLSGVKIVQAAIVVGIAWPSTTRAGFMLGVDIAGGGWHSAALTDDGEVYAWGRGEHGRLGLGGYSKMVPEKVQLLVGAHIVQDLVEALKSVAYDS